MQQVSQQTIEEAQKDQRYDDPNRKKLIDLISPLHEGDIMYVSKRFKGKGWQYVGPIQMTKENIQIFLTDPDLAIAFTPQRAENFVTLNNSKQPDLEAQQSVGRIDRRLLDSLENETHKAIHGLLEDALKTVMDQDWPFQQNGKIILHSDGTRMYEYTQPKIKKQRPQPEPKPIILHDGATYTKGKIWTVDNDGDIFDIDLGLFSRKEFKSLVKNGVHFYSTKMSAELGRKEIYESWRFNTDDGQSLKLAQDVWVIDKSTKEVFSFELHAGSRKNSKRFIYISTKKIADSVVNTKNLIDEALKMFVKWK